MLHLPPLDKTEIMPMGAIFSSPQRDSDPDPELLAAEAAARKRAEDERLAEVERKREEQAAFGANLRGRRSLLSASFTGFGQRGTFTPASNGGGGQT